jgi:hypothetical protein
MCLACDSAKKDCAVAKRPTLLVDEADSFANGSNELRGIIDSGHTRSTAWVIRCVGENHEACRFSTWAPKAFASIGGLAGTVEDRSVILPMQRKRREQKVARLRHRDNSEFAELRSKAARWAQDSMQALAAADDATEVPAELNDRDADNWQPLLAIADLAGGEWPKRARDAALALSGVDEPNSLGTQLLADIKAAFRPGEEAVTTRGLLDRLTADPERPWADFRHGKPLSPKQLGSRLAQFGIRSETVHLAGEAHAKGYVRSRFDEAWAIYVPSPDEAASTDAEGADGRETTVSTQEGGSETCKRASADEMGTSATFPKRAEGGSARIGKAQEMPVGRGFARLHASGGGGSGENGEFTVAGPAGNGAAAPAPMACPHCGSADGRVRPVSIDGEHFWLHPACERAFLAALDATSGPAVGQDAGNAATPSPSAARGNGAQRAAPAPVCEQCGTSEGDLREYRARLADGAHRAAVLHVLCACPWSQMRGATLSGGARMRP